MPELPDVNIYVEALRERVRGRALQKFNVIGLLVLRTVEPPHEELLGQFVVSVERLGKRIVLEFENGLLLVVHLMIAGRLRWQDAAKVKRPGKIGLAELVFEHGTLWLTEAGTKKRASMHVLADRSGLADHDRGGLEVLEASLSEFAAVLRSENHTIKRTLTSPSLISGIGNAYSDEILHAARMSPLLLTSKMTDADIERLYHAARDTLQHWIEELRLEFKGRFPGPGQITAFRDGFAVHGRFEQPCPVCRQPVQRIRYADNETNYCAACQTGGRVLADRSLSRLLKNDWPRTLE